jgi:hypothetical protein
MLEGLGLPDLRYANPIPSSYPSYRTWLEWWGVVGDVMSPSNKMEESTLSVATIQPT